MIEKIRMLSCRDEGPDFEGTRIEVTIGQRFTFGVDWGFPE